MKHVWSTTPFLLLGLLELFKMFATAVKQRPITNICHLCRKPETYQIDTSIAWLEGYKVHYHILRCNSCDETWKEEQWRIKEKCPFDLLDMS
jgi:hypothetical protein